MPLLALILGILYLLPKKLMGFILFPLHVSYNSIMEIKSHPTKKNRAIVTVENYEDETVVDLRAPEISVYSIKSTCRRVFHDLTFKALNEAVRGESPYPRDHVLTHRELGYIGYRSYLDGDFDAGRQVNQFFEQRAAEVLLAHVSFESQRI